MTTLHNPRGLANLLSVIRRRCQRASSLIEDAQQIVKERASEQDGVWLRDVDTLLGTVELELTETQADAELARGFASIEVPANQRD